jgi:hypothetical protein
MHDETAVWAECWKMATDCSLEYIKVKKNSMAFSLQVNYTD